MKRLNEVKRFLDGLKDTEKSKVYIDIKVENGSKYLCVYLNDNTSESFRLEF